MNIQEAVARLKTQGLIKVTPPTGQSVPAMKQQLKRHPSHTPPAQVATATTTEPYAVGGGEFLKNTEEEETVKTLEEFPQCAFYSSGKIERLGKPVNEYVKMCGGEKHAKPYICVSLKSISGKWKTKTKHRLIAEAFHGPPTEDRPMALHKNDNPKDNRASNLYWGNAKDNARDAIENGLIKCGEDCSYSKISSAKAIEIFKRCHSGETTIRELSKEYGLAEETISSIKFGRTWRRDTHGSGAKLTNVCGIMVPVTKGRWGEVLSRRTVYRLPTKRNK